MTRSRGSNGIGFAIPSDLVAAFVAQARNGRREFGRPWAGINGQTVDADMAEALGLARPGGIVVSGLHPQSPFAGAGLEMGDVIVEIDGDAVNTPPEMIYHMSVAGFGTTVNVGFLRDGALRETRVELLEAPETPPREETVLGSDALLAGMRVSGVNPAVIAERNLPLEATGVLVLDPGRLGSRVGLRAGDVIEAVNGRAVARPGELAAALGSGEGGFALAVLRSGQPVVLRFRT